MTKKPLEIDCIAGSELRDTQGEMLSIDGADISVLESGKGRWNDNHGAGFFNSLGRVSAAKKIYKEEDCTDDRHRYYWNKVKSPFIYARGFLYDDEDHPNARAAAAILRNIHKADCPLRLKASVEGGVVSRGIKDSSLLAQTKVHSVALTFTPANQATLVEPLNLDKSQQDTEADYRLIKSVIHLATTDVPSFRHITRQASADKIHDNVKKIRNIAKDAGLQTEVHLPDIGELIYKAVSEKVLSNVERINALIKALSAGYGGAGSPTSRTGGSVLQAEALEGARGFTYITCDKCGDENVYMKHQTKCRTCGQHYSFDRLARTMVTKK